MGPQYDGKYLHKLVREKLGNTKLEHTLTNVVIPAFDIKNLQPAIFSSFQVHPSSSQLQKVTHLKAKIAAFCFSLTKLLLSNMMSQVKKRPYLNAALSDICISTSAAPTYLPAHCFETKTSTASFKFDLVDGGVAANNPVLYYTVSELILIIHNIITHTNTIINKYKFNR